MSTFYLSSYSECFLSICVIAVLTVEFTLYICRHGQFLLNHLIFQFLRLCWIILLIFVVHLTHFSQSVSKLTGPLVCTCAVVKFLLYVLLLVTAVVNCFT